ncbi:MAG: radical SAM protein, partial [Eggerthellaceae bacterium]|nr:radical SAM protein [Eggerthellaceae bacterium]
TNMEPPLMDDVREGSFVEAGELERYYEMREFIKQLEIETTFACRHTTMPYGFTVHLPEQKDDVLRRIDEIIEEGDEYYMRLFKASIKEV